MAEDYVFQHYVPEFYMRKFADSENYLHCLNVNENRRFRMKAGENSKIQIAASDYFYDESEEKILERGLGDLEGNWADSIRKLLIEGSFRPLADEVKADLLLFITMQYIRTREPRKQLLEHLDEADDNDDTSLPSDLVNALQSNEGRDTHLIIMKKVTELLFDRLHEHGEFHLYINPTDIPFITSDNPVVQYHQTTPNKYDYRDAIGVGGIDWELYLPFTPNYCFSIRCIHTFGDTTGKSSVDEEFVNNHNTLQLVNASDIVICNNPSYDGVNQVWE